MSETTERLWGVFLMSGQQICLPATGEPGLEYEVAARLADSLAAPTYLAIVGEEEA